MISLETLEKIPVGCLVLNDKGIIEYYNSELIKIFGKPEFEIKGKIFSELLPNQDLSFDRLLKITTGEEFWIKVPEKNEIKPIFLKMSEIENKILAIVVDLSNITSNYSLEEQFEKKLTIREVSSMFSHDVANPLAIIYSKISLLKKYLSKGPPDINDVNKYVESLQSASERIGNLIKKFRNYTKDGDLEQTGLVEVNELISTTLKIFRRQNPELNKFLIVEGLNTSDVFIKVRHKHVAQSLKAIIKNACEAASKTENPWAKILIKNDGATVFIHICDNGPGISEENLDHIFEMFWTTKKEGKGLGLGLGLTKRLIELNNGKLEYEGQKPHTEFVISFPLFRN